MPAPKLRSIRHEPSFDKAADSIEADPERWDEVLQAIEWALLHHIDDVVPPPEGSALGIIKVFPSDRHPPLRVFYSVESDELCALWWVEPDPNAFPGIDDDDSEDGEPF